MDSEAAFAPMALRDNTQDQVIYRDVILWNEYRLPYAFQADDTVIDVGAHVGCFARACLARGVGRIVCFEPHPDNFALLKYNVRDPRAELVRAAAWRSDRRTAEVHLHDFGPRATAMHRVKPDGKLLVSAISLDSVLRNFSTVRLLKLDCEGSEYPILHTAKELGRVREIAVELHLSYAPAEWAEQWDCSPRGMTSLLEAQGFEVEIVASDRSPAVNQWLFARKKEPALVEGQRSVCHVPLRELAAP